MLTKKVFAFPARPKSITAPEGKGLEMAMKMERHAHEALRRNEKMLRESRDFIIAQMGDATEMVFPDGGRYVRETVQRQGFSVDPTDYTALTYYEPTRDE